MRTYSVHVLCTCLLLKTDNVPKIVCIRLMYLMYSTLKPITLPTLLTLLFLPYLRLCNTTEY